MQFGAQTNIESGSFHKSNIEGVRKTYHPRCNATTNVNQDWHNETKNNSNKLVWGFK